MNKNATPGFLNGSSFAVYRLWMAVILLLLAALACNAPAPTEAQNPPPADTVVAPASTEPPTPSLPTASPTLEPLDPMLILDTYPSLAAVRERLAAMSFVSTSGGQTLTGRQLLEYFLVERKYNPADGSAVNQDLFAEFAKYTLPYPAAKIYIINVATGLFGEAHRLQPWSLADYSPQQINNLFIQDESVMGNESDLHRGDIPADMPNTMIHYYPVPDDMIADAHFKQFNFAHRLAAGAATQEQAVISIVGWMTQNFFHAYNPGYSWDVYLDGRAPLPSGPVAFPLTIERIYDERVTGCHEPVILLDGMLHSLNIPSVPLSIQGHAVLYLPTLDRYIHGDHLDGYPFPPPETLLLTPDEMRPIAADSGIMFDIIEQTKYTNQLGTIRLRRDGGTLVLRAENLRGRTGNCVEVDAADWARITTQLSSFNLQYDTKTCTLSGDGAPILTLDQLSAPAP